MKNGLPIVFGLSLLTVVLVVAGIVAPTQFAIGIASTPARTGGNSSPQAAVQDVLNAIRRRDWGAAYAGLANKSQLSQPEFIRDLTGSYSSLRSYATLDSFDVSPVRNSSDASRFRAQLNWASVVGTFQDTRDLQTVKVGDQWQVVWPTVPEPKVPPQVIPVNYLRWDVIYRGAGDDWGTQDVDAPHVRIVDMHPVDRGDNVVIMGELLNDDVVPAYVEVKASLLGKDGSAIATEDSFDKISHILLPKQVTPFRIDFPDTRLSQVDSVKIQPSATLIAASADPVIAIQDQRITPVPEPSLNGDLVNQSGQVVNIAHVLGTFYDGSGQLVWVSDGYANRALLPQTPVPFAVALPADLADKVKNYRVVASTYSSEHF